MQLVPLQFIGEPVQVYFSKPPAQEKTPGPPDGFIWRSQDYKILQVLSEWVDYHRRGRMARNMQPQHAAIATRRGSWGVGEFHFQVRTDSDQFFELYYDRAPKDASHRKGEWFLFQELAEK
jgi:hypothetical protein